MSDTRPTRLQDLRDELTSARKGLMNRTKEKAEAWEQAPGNVMMGHVYLNAMNYHRVFHEWDSQRKLVLHLEQRLRALESAGEL